MDNPTETTQAITDPLDVVVKRSEWCRGQNNNQGSQLLIRDSQSPFNKCCLGFVCLAAGMTPDQIGGRNYPYSLCYPTPGGGAAIPLDEIPVVVRNLIKEFETHNNFPECGNSRLSSDMAATNDRSTRHILDAEREAELTRLGKEAGINFTFVD